MANKQSLLIVACIAVSFLGCVALLLSTRWWMPLSTPAYLTDAGTAKAAASSPAAGSAVPPGLSDFENGALLRQPVGMQGTTFGFAYPEMEPQVWPGELSIAQAKDKPGYVPSIDRFPVFLTWLSYQPWDVDHAPARVIPRRPLQILRDGNPDNERQPSPYNSLDLVHNARIESDPRYKNVKGNWVGYLGSRGIPYELAVYCGYAICKANVYSERSRFAFRLEFPSEAVAHTRELIDAVDGMIVSWAPADNIVETHWRDPASIHAAPVDDTPTPPDCSPGYVRRTMAVKDGGPTLVATSSTGDVFFAGAGADLMHKKIYRIPAASIEASTMRMEVYSTDDMGFIDGLAVDAQGRVYVSQGRGLIFRAEAGDRIAPHFSVFAEDLSGNAYHFKFDSQGDIIYIDFQAGDVIRMSIGTGAGRDSRLPVKGGPDQGRESRMAIGFDRAAGLALDQSDDVYVVDEARRRIERVTPVGVVQIIPAELRRPGAIALDVKGNLFLIDNALAPIQRISPSGKACAVTHDVRSPYSDIAVDGHGRVFATNLLDHLVDEFVPDEHALGQ